MGYDGTVKIGTKLDKSGLDKGLSGLGGYAKKGFSVLGSAATSAAKIATGAIAGVGTAMAGLATMGIKYNASIEGYETSFEVMTGSAEKAKEVIENLKKVGAETPFELTDLADTTQLLMNYGFTADEAMDKMMMLGDISQGSADKMGRIATAYGQMSSAGKVSLEDIKQMIEAGFNPLQEISDSTGESMASLYERISAGTLTVEEITASMQRATSEGGKYYQSMEKQSQTINGMISTLKDNAIQLVGEVVQPLTESIGTQLLPAAIDAINQLTVAFQTEGVPGLIAAGGEILSNVVVGIAEALPGLIEIAATTINSFITSLGDNLPSLTQAGWDILNALIDGAIQILPNLAMLALQIVTGLVTGLINNAPQLLEKGRQMFSDFIQAIKDKLPDALSTGTNIISNLLSGLEEKTPEIIEQAKAMLLDWVGAILDTLPDVMQTGADVISDLLQGLVDYAPDIITQAGTMLADYLAEIAAHLPEILEKGGEIIGELLAGMIEAAADLIASIPGILKDIASAFMDYDWSSIGSNIIEGIKGGIRKMAGSLATAAKNAASGAIDTVKGWLGINSPSKRARDEIGVNMIAGINEGVENETPNLLKASRGSAEAALEEMKKASAADMVSRMQSASYSLTENEMSARNKYQNDGYDPEHPDNDTAINIHNEFNVDGTHLIEETVKKTKKEIQKEQMSESAAKGDVVFA